MTPRFTRSALMLATAAVLVAALPAAAQEAPAGAAQFVTLGTNSGPRPNPERAEPANLLRAEGQNILIDAGDGVAWQLSKAGVDLGAVNAVVISHLHFDHIGGLYGFLSMRYQGLRQTPLTIYGPPGTRAMVAGMVTSMAAASEGANNMRGQVPGGPDANLTVVEVADGAAFAIGPVSVKAVRNSHFSATPHGDDPLYQSLSYRFDMPGRSIVYTGDTGPSPAVMALAKGADLLVSEIMDPQIAYERIKRLNPDRPEPVLRMLAAHFEHEHLSPAEVGKLAAGAGVRALVLTHNALPDDAIEGARAGIAASYKGPVTFAKDLDRF